MNMLQIAEIIFVKAVYERNMPDTILIHGKNSIQRFVQNQSITLYSNLCKNNQSQKIMIPQVR